MTDKKRIHIVSHTHWDREWYLTLEEYRIKLVDLVDHLSVGYINNINFVFCPSYFLLL